MDKLENLRIFRNLADFPGTAVIILVFFKPEIQNDDSEKPPLTRFQGAGAIRGFVSPHPAAHLPGGGAERDLLLRLFSRSLFSLFSEDFLSQCLA